MMGSFHPTPQHLLGTKVQEMADRCCERGEMKVMFSVILPNNRECVIAVYRPTQAEKTDANAP